MKTLQVDDEAHKLAVNKQKELFEKNKVRINLVDIFSAAVKEGISNVDKRFGITEIGDKK